MIYPVILCGGSGTRLWPLSRASYPKQFQTLVGARSLFQSTVERLSGATYATPTIVTGSDFRFIVAQQFAEIGVDPHAVLIEPDGRNTAPAALAAALRIADQDPDAAILIAPSDHVIPDADAFHAAVARGLPLLRDSKFVTFGVAPERPETGYGYLELAHPPVEGAPVPLSRFIEKPDLDRAKQLVAAGAYLWNAGLFLCSAKALVDAFDRLAPGIAEACRAALAAAKPDLGFLRLDPEAWSRAENISIDYAIMEKSDNLMVVPFSAGWSDLGSWEAIWREQEPDADGVVANGAAAAIDCRNTLLRAEDSDQVLVGLGLENIVAIAMPDAVLVADKRRAEAIKSVVATLKEKGAKQAEQFPRDHRPWGWFESLIIGDRFQVKRIVVNPGASLSLQSHHHRAEHWIVVHGTAKVTINDHVQLVTENQSVYVQLGAIHRMENPGKVPMVLIEVQTGSYLGEDDIVRYEDVYAR